MLFNSYPFLFAFLPVALAIHWAVERMRPEWRVGALVLLSFAFYGYWDWRFLPLIVVSIGVNWFLAEPVRRAGSGLGLALALGANLLVLAVFKYAAYGIELLDLLPGVDLARPNLALPLGISFFTFHHVMYLTDYRAGRAPRYGLVDYAFYISFFPQVLAGPLVRWSEVMHQLGERPYARPDASERIARGLMLFTVGLAKKVYLGDPLAATVNPVYAVAAGGGDLTVSQAWQAVLGFTFQIYFDFSGYTDMALGLALLFGIVLPQNFDVPYRAVSLQDFWRRWHMTLSRFLRDYLYVPLGGNRHGLAVQVGALLATMTLGGLWHGAGTTFVAWGLLHGIGLAVGLGWRRAGLPMPALLGWLLTFVFVALTWILFRAGTFDTALRIAHALFGGGPLGREFRPRVIGFAALVAFLGPTAWTLVHRLPPWRSLALAFALLFVLIVFKIGDDANYEFIYFQF